MKAQMSRRRLLVGAAAMACAGRVSLAALEGVADGGVADGGVANGGVANGGVANGGPVGPSTENRVADVSPRDQAAINGAGHRATSDAAKQLAALEKREGGRMGVEAWDTATGKRIQHRSDERFAMCSVFKFLAAGAILKRVDQGTEQLDRRIEFGESDLLEYAPVAKKRVKEGGLTLGELCAAAVEWSDNTAANLMLKVLGGPEGVTSFIRSTGDQITRLDNIEPALNVVPPGEVHDTTTASSMVGLLNSVVLGKVLSAESRARLEGWMLDAKVGELRLRAGLPGGWRIAHKTGTYDDQTNDVGIIWPSGRAPIIVAALYNRGGTRGKQREGVLREVGRIVATSL